MLVREPDGPPCNQKQTSFVSTYVVIHGKWPRDITEARMITWVFILPGLVMLWIDFRRSCCRISFVCRKHSQIQPENKKTSTLVDSKIQNLSSWSHFESDWSFFHKKKSRVIKEALLFSWINRLNFAPLNHFQTFTPNFDGSKVFVHKFLQQSACRTEFPEEADVFFVPMYASCVMSKENIFAKASRRGNPGVFWVEKSLFWISGGGFVFPSVVK